MHLNKKSTYIFVRKRGSLIYFLKYFFVILSNVRSKINCELIDLTIRISIQNLSKCFNNTFRNYVFFKFHILIMNYSYDYLHYLKKYYSVSASFSLDVLRHEASCLTRNWNWRYDDCPCDRWSGKKQSMGKRRLLIEHVGRSISSPVV